VNYSNLCTFKELYDSVIRWASLQKVHVSSLNRRDEKTGIFYVVLSLSLLDPVHNPAKCLSKFCSHKRLLLQQHPIKRVFLLLF